MSFSDYKTIESPMYQYIDGICKPMKKKLRSAFLLESLEARLLFSADMAPVPVDGGIAGAGNGSDLEISLRPDSGGLQEADTERQERREVIFVDEAVDDFDQLIADLESQLEHGRRFNIVALDSDHDGIAQISAYLSQQEGIHAVHVISHGSDGAVKLGNVWLTADTLDAYAEAIEGWQQSLSSDADLLFYGCNLAAGDEGQDLVNTLTLLTGADVAASDDVTGSAQFGGDWTLEYNSGEIEASVPFSTNLQTNWSGLLNTFTVTTTTDGGAGSLRQAIIDANALGGPNEIILNAGTYKLDLGPAGDDNANNGDLDITGDLIITGAGADVTIIDGNSLDRVFHLIGNSANLTLKDLTVTGGSINEKGGGIFVEHLMAQLTATRVIVTENIAAEGAGIFNDGTMTLTDVVISNNGDATTMEGGGINNKEAAILERVTISGNRAEKVGGSGGGIHDDSVAWSLSLTNVTVSGNSADGKGGGLHTQNAVTILNSTFTLNSANSGGGISNNGGTVNIKNTIVAENLASTDPDVEGTFNSQGNNLIGDKDAASGFTDGVNGDQIGTAGSPVDPLLSALQDNGGFSPTHALLAGSPTIDAGDDSVGLTEDQRGYARPIDGDGDATATIDIGAFEVTSNILVVDTTSDIKDAPDASTIANLLADVGADGRISLREAIMATNGTGNLATPDEIHFNIPLNDVRHFYYQDDLTPGSLTNIVATTLDDASIVDFDPDYPGTRYSWYTIQPATVLPDITDAVILDATSQPGYPGKPIIEIDGTSVATGDQNGLTLQAGGSTIRGFVINRFKNDGIEIELANGNTIEGNYIGTDVTGTLDRGNAHGISIKSGGNIIGGTTPEKRNIISGNDGDGVSLAGLGTSANVIQGNYIGTDASGTAVLGNTDDGIVIYDNASDITVGGNAEGEGNIISGNGSDGIQIGSVSTAVSNITIQGNLIGTDVTGAFGLPNTQAGIDFEDGQNILIGGTAANAGNTIAFNGGRGIEANSNGSNISMLTNSIYANSGLGIDWGVDNVTPNNSGEQNYPVLTSSVTDGFSTITINGALNSMAGTTFRIEFFASAVEDGSGYGEGETYLGSTTVTTDGAGDATFSTPLSAAVVVGQFITATATEDFGGNQYGDTSEFASNIAATAVNNPPTVVTNAPLNVPEETSRTITPAYLQTTDPDNSPDQVIYTLTNLPTGGSVELNGTPLTLGQTFTQDDINNNRVTYRDIDEGVTTSFTVTVSDGNTTLPAFSFSINGQPINDAPVVSAPGSALNATEQTGLAIQGTGFSVSDVDEAGVGALATLAVGEGTISVVVGNSGVSIDSGDGTGLVTLSGSIAQLSSLLTGTSTGTITYLNSSDNPSSNTILTVTVNDQGNTGADPGLTGDGSSEEGSNSVTIDIASVNDAPVINNATFSVDEKSTDGTAVGNVPVTDPDAGDTHVYSITAGNTGGAFAIDNAGKITVANSAALNFETTPLFTLTVQVRDQGGTGLIDTATITINLSDVATTITAGQTFGVSETATNGTVVGSVATIGDSPTSFTIIGGNTGNAFAIDASGNITVNDAAAINYETLNSYTLTVEVNDGTITTSETVTVNVTDVATTITAGQTFGVSESAANGTAVGTVATTGDAPTGFNITAGNTFAIDASGNITVNDATAINYETLNSYTLTVEVNDGTSTTSETVTINVTDVNDAPVINNATFNIDENSTNGTAVGSVPVTDPDAGDTHVYSITAGNTGGAFAIDNAGNVTVANSAAVNFEATPVFTLTVQVQDQGGTGLTDTATITVNLNDINDAPVINDATFNVDENSTNGTAVGTVQVTDDDSGDTHVYSITAGNTGGAFAIDNTGNITVANSSALNFEATPIFTLTVQVQDQGGTGLTDTAIITVNLNDINDAGTVTIDNMTPAQGDTLTATVTDTDGATGAIAYQWYRGASAIVGATSATYATVQADVGSVISVTATYTDDLGAAETPTSAATAAVTNVNDPGTVSISNTTPAQGDTLTAGVTDPDGASGAIAYQWKRDGADIGGATTNTYTTVQADVGAVITVSAIYTDDLSGAESLISAPTAAVTNVNDPGTVSISNTTPAQGDTLIAGVIDADGASGAIGHQWFSDGAAIGGATGKTYTTTQADVGTIITVTAVYTDDLGTAENLTSAPTAPVTNLNEAPVAVNDNLNATEDQSMTLNSVTDLLGNDTDIDGDALTISEFTQPVNGTLADNADGTFTYTPTGNFNGTDNFTYTISDGNGGTASGTAIIFVAPVGDTPQVTNVSTNAEVQSGLIYINRNASDGVEVTHFKISGITNGTLYLADGVTRIENGDFITVEQGQAGLKFRPVEDSTADGSFNVESSENGFSVASQSGIAASNITVMTPAPAPPAPKQSPPSSNPEKVVTEEVVEEKEESEDLEDVADEPDVQPDANNRVSVETPQPSKVLGTAKPSFNPDIASLKRADSDSDEDKTPDRRMRLSPQTLKMLIETDNIGELKTALKKLGITTLSPEEYELVRGSLDAIKDEIGKEILLGKTVLGSAIATSVGLSAGYVVWMLKGGSLLASILSSLPAWQLADPLAILVGKKEDEDDDDDSLETIIKDGAGRDEDKDSKASDLDNLKKESAKP